LRKGTGDTARKNELFWALKDVSFDVRKGEVVGIIGRNGAGKTTLLKILSRITTPTTGRIELRGRLASLLEVGTGFHPELTGRENIFLNGAILGMTRAEITKRFDDIVQFSEVDQFLDTPVKRYSSGMYVRLAFAVAAHLETEILIVDEVLAVGDVLFQNKCLGKMETFGREGRTVLFVSHNMQSIRRLCNRAILLSEGSVIADGASSAVVGEYLGQSQPGAVPTEAALKQLVNKFPADPDCRIRAIGIFQNGIFTTRPENGKQIDIVFEYEILKAIYGFHVWFRVHDSEGNILFESQSCCEDDTISTVKPGLYQSIATIPSDFLAPRQYEVSFDAGIAYGRHFFPEPIRIVIEVQPSGRINRLFPGYESPGLLMPSIPWRLSRLSQSSRNSGSDHAVANVDV
jgi:lipopolysaccharide transport system ATP-binding protein